MPTIIIKYTSVNNGYGVNYLDSDYKTSSYKNFVLRLASFNVYACNLPVINRCILAHEYLNYPIGQKWKDQVQVIGYLTF